MKLRSYLILLVVAAVLPVVIYAGFMTYVSHRAQSEKLARGLVERTRALSAALDREFLISIQSLKVLSASERLEKGQLAGFYAEAKKALAAYGRAWPNVTLLDSDGQQLVNLRRPFGSPLPRVGDPEMLKQILQSREPVISNLFQGPVTAAPAVAVGVPVIRNGQVKYVVVAGFSPARLMDLLLEQNLPSSWLATIIDKNHRVVARSRDIDKFIGKEASPTFIAQARRSQEATWKGKTLDGSVVVAALHRSDFSGWTVGLGTPAQEIDTLLNKSLALTGIGGLVLLSAAIVAAAALGRRIDDPIATLSGAAEKLGQGEMPKIPPLPIIEIDRVARAMEDAAAQRARAEDHASSLLAETESSRRSLLSALEEEKRIKQALLQHAALVANSSDFIGLADPGGQGIFINDAGRRLVGLAEQRDVRSTSIYDYLSDAGQAQARKEILPAILSGESWRGETELRHFKTGAAIPVEMAAFTVRDSQTGATMCLAIVSRDITERKRTEHEIQDQTALAHLLKSLAVSASEAETTDEALAASVKHILDYGKWSIGHVAHMKRDDERWRVVGSQWHFSDPSLRERYRDFIAVSESTQFGHPDGTFLTRALLDREPQWIADLGEFDGASRIAYAKKKGLVAAFAFPVIVQDAVVACIEFFAEEPRPRNDTLIRSIFSVAAQLARVMERKQAEEALRRNEQRLRAIIETEPECVKVIATDGTLLEMNAAGLRMIEADSPEQVIGQRVEFLVSPEHRQDFLALNRRVFAGDSGMLEFEVISLKGRRRWLETHATPLRDENNQITGLLGVTRDITERKRAEQALQTHYHELQTLNDVSQAILQSRDLATMASAILNEALAISGCEFGGVRLMDPFSQKFEPIASYGYRDTENLNYHRRYPADQATGRVLRIFARRRTVVIENVEEEEGLRVFKREGLQSIILIPVLAGNELLGALQLGSRTRRTFEANLINMLETLGSYFGIAVQKADLLKEAIAAQDQLRRLSRKLVEVQETERRRIARELHDEIGSLLTGLKLILGVKDGRATDQAHAIIDEMLAKARSLSHDLRPPMLDDLGLSAALAWHLKEFTARTRIQVEFHSGGIECRFSPDIEIAAYRIVQEALTNIARHARAATATVTLWTDTQTLGIEITDQGVGFDQTAVLPAASGGGLTGIRERVAQVNGHIMIASHPGAGTCITVKLPLDQTAETKNETSVGIIG